jgi:hypothetical protein
MLRSLASTIAPRCAGPPHRTLRDVGVRVGDLLLAHWHDIGTTLWRYKHKRRTRTSVPCAWWCVCCLITLHRRTGITRTWLLTQIPQQRRCTTKTRFCLSAARHFILFLSSSLLCRVIPCGDTWVVETCAKMLRTLLNKQRLNVGRP